MVQIPETHADLLTPAKKAVAFLALVRKDGTPHLTPLWFMWDGKHIVFNMSRERVKAKLMHQHPMAAIVIPDPANPYRYLGFRGPVAEETETGTEKVLGDLSEKYTGKRDFPVPPGQVRVTYKVLPEHVYTYG